MFFDVELTAVITWIAIAVLAGVIEVLNPHLGSIFATAGAVAAALAAFAGFGFAVQAIAFLAVFLISLTMLRDRLTGHLGGRGVPSRTESLIGRHGVVTHAIDPLLGHGRVTVNGEVWAAKSGVSIEAGATVRVVAADGIVLEVTRA